MKLRGATGHMYLAQDKVIGDIFRCLITAQFLTPPDDRFGQITLSPTWQNFPIKLQGEEFGNLDNYFKSLNDRGVYVMANLLNGFNKKYTLPLKALPKNAPGLSSDDMASWTLFRKMCEQFALRYGNVKDDSKIDIADFSIRYSDGRLVAPQSKVSGLGTVKAMQIWNELNNTWVKPELEGRLSGKQCAHVLHYVVEGIWGIDPSMAIVAQCTAGWHINYWQEFFTEWEAHYGSFPNYSPQTNTGIAISFNQYLLGGCGAFSKCRVKPAEVEIPRIGKEANDFLKSRGAYALVTEHGCATELNSDLGYPDYPGLDKYQSQAKFIIDSTNLWLGFSNILGVMMYQYTDDPNEPRFRYTGLLEHGTGNEKPSYAIVKDAFSKPIPQPVNEPITSKTFSQKKLTLNGKYQLQLQ